jgi:hypothetical protein
VATALVASVVISVLIQSFAFLALVTTRVNVGALAAATILACSVLIGAVAILGLRDYRADSATRLATKTMLLASPLWLITGSILEVLRGNWAVWLSSATSLLIVQTWVYIVAHGSPPQKVDEDVQS